MNEEYKILKEFFEQAKAADEIEKDADSFMLRLFSIYLITREKMSALTNQCTRIATAPAQQPDTASNESGNCGDHRLPPANDTPAGDG